MKRTNCDECGKTLTGMKTRFCSDACYLYAKGIRQIKKSVLFHTNFKPRPCVTCSAEFRPKRKAHYTCSRACSQIEAMRKQKAKRAAEPPREKQPPDTFRYTKVAPEKITTHVKPVFCQSDGVHQTLKNEVLRFIKKGGCITKLPAQMDGKTPAINFAHSWHPDELMGFGYEIAAQEVLSEQVGNVD